jgi:hypothetical protein
MTFISNQNVTGTLPNAMHTTTNLAEFICENYLAHKIKTKITTAKVSSVS